MYHFFLTSAAGIYRVLLKIHQFLRSFYRPIYLPYPVISIGGLSLGGDGKTPVVQYLAQYLNQKGHKVVVLTRGYKGQQKGPLWVQENDTAQQVGDEALMLYRSLKERHIPVCISQNLFKLPAFFKAHPLPSNTVVLWDNGHQNPFLHKNLRVLVVNNTYGFGNKSLFPAGPLKQPLKTGLSQTDLILSIKNASDRLHPDIPGNIPSVFMTPQDACPLPTGIEVYAFCGLGRPLAFYQSLQNYGYILKEFRSFSDHHRYTTEDEQELLKQALLLQVPLITTLKDAVKLSDAFKKKVTLFQRNLHWTDLKNEEIFCNILKALVSFKKRH